MKLSEILIAVMLTVTLSSCHDTNSSRSESKLDSENLLLQTKSTSRTLEPLPEPQNQEPLVDQCDVNSVELSIFTTDDSSFEYYNCKEEDDNFYILEYLKIAKQNILIYKKADDGGYDYPKSRGSRYL